MTQSPYDELQLGSMNSEEIVRAIDAVFKDWNNPVPPHSQNLTCNTSECVWITLNPDRSIRYDAATGIFYATKGRPFQMSSFTKGMWEDCVRDLKTPPSPAVVPLTDTEVSWLSAMQGLKDANARAVIAWNTYDANKVYANYTPYLDAKRQQAASQATFDAECVALAAEMRAKSTPKES